MKKLFVALMVCTLPVLALTGCTDSPILNKFATSKNGPDFLCAVSDKLGTFKANIENKMIADVAGEEGEEGEADSEVGFDFSAFSNDETAKVIWQDDVWAAVDKANTENMFAMVAYNIYEKNQDFSYADLSFMSSTESDTLKDFYIEKTNSVNGTNTYIANLTGFEDPSLNLPVPQVSNPDLVDRADDVIKQLGNYLEFTVSKRDISTEIKVDTGFVMPTEQEVQNAKAGTDVLYQMLETNSVALIYDHENQTYTKLVTFAVQPNGDVKKFVKKYEGDVTQTGNYAGGQEYEYTLEVADGARYDVCCDYTIVYSAADGGVFCQQKRENNAYTWAEYYLVETAELVGRIKENTVGGRTTIDLLINQDLISGSIKYNYQRSSISKNTTQNLRNEQVLRKDFTAFTQEEISVAKSNSALNAQILSYVITEDKLAINYASNS